MFYVVIVGYCGLSLCKIILYGVKKDKEKGLDKEKKEKSNIKKKYKEIKLKRN